MIRAVRVPARIGRDTSAFPFRQRKSDDHHCLAADCPAGFEVPLDISARYPFHKLKALANGMSASARKLTRSISRPLHQTSPH